MAEHALEPLSPFTAAAALERADAIEVEVPRGEPRRCSRPSPRRSPPASPPTSLARAADCGGRGARRGGGGRRRGSARARLPPGAALPRPGRVDHGGARGRRAAARRDGRGRARRARSRARPRGRAGARGRSRAAEGRGLPLRGELSARRLRGRRRGRHGGELADETDDDRRRRRPACDAPFPRCARRGDRGRDAATAATIDRLLDAPMPAHPPKDALFLSLARGLVEEAIAERGFPW